MIFYQNLAIFVIDAYKSCPYQTQQPPEFYGGGIKYLIIKELNNDSHPRPSAADRFVMDAGDCHRIPGAFISLEYN